VIDVLVDRDPQSFRVGNLPRPEDELNPGFRGLVLSHSKSTSAIRVIAS
jgi:hypothetical protein